MSDSTLRAGAWVALVIQLLVGAAVARHRVSVSAIVVLNLVAAAAVLVYWGRRWYGYLFHGITWYAVDQLIPLSALLVCGLAVLTLLGRFQAVGVHWAIFILNTLALFATVLFFSFFRITRLF
jgi:exosortase/archaeosortase